MIQVATQRLCAGVRHAIGLIFVLCFVFTTAAFAEMITAEGVAAIIGNVTIAREKAIDDAIRR
ncbi:MAG: hypothetical protein HW385_1372, partial [candidate division NC10 bacterium]|nr:hypothetical protein [candidate division NC10 bacterium]